MVDEAPLGGFLEDEDVELDEEDEDGLLDEFVGCSFFFAAEEDDAFNEEEDEVFVIGLGFGVDLDEDGCTLFFGSSLVFLKLLLDMLMINLIYKNT